MKKLLLNRWRRGQTMVFLVMVVVILAFIALWNFDLHKVIYIKTLTRNAGDGAALAAARWQGITLNLLGELNAAQAVAINDELLRGGTNFAEARAIAELQARVCFAGPMVGFAAAQQAGKNNGVHVNRDFTSQVLSHAIAIRAFAAAMRAQNLAQPPYVNADGSTAWDDYADMLHVVGGDGVVAMPGRQSPYSGYHILLDQGFYQAIATMNWCWFYNHARNLLQTYAGWQSWPPLPPLFSRNFNASEYFPINVTTIPYLDTLAGYMGDNTMPTRARQQLSQVAGKALVSEVAQVPAAWYCYNHNYWFPWSDWINTNQNSGSAFPWISTVRPQYDVAGCDAGLAVVADSSATLFSKKQYSITWVAAAKPFGYLDGDVPPHTYGIVLPAFRDVRLIPYDSKISPDGSTPDDLGWIEHITAHLPIYMKYGPDGIQDLLAHCNYCRNLITWEDPAFRQTGVAWLQTYWTNCIARPGGGGGGGGGGGTSHGH